LASDESETPFFISVFLYLSPEAGSIYGATVRRKHRYTTRAGDDASATDTRSRWVRGKWARQTGVCRKRLVGITLCDVLNVWLRHE
jgi:hypothetical protein